MRATFVLIGIIGAALFVLAVSVLFHGNPIDTPFGVTYRPSYTGTFLAFLGKFAIWISIPMAVAWGRSALDSSFRFFALMTTLFVFACLAEMIRPGMYGRLLRLPIAGLAPEYFSICIAFTLVLMPLVLRHPKTSGIAYYGQVSIIQILLATALVALIASLIRMNYSWISVVQFFGTAALCCVIGTQLSNMDPRNYRKHEYFVTGVTVLLLIALLIVSSYIQATMAMFTIDGLLPFVLAFILISSVWSTALHVLTVE